MLSHLSPAAIGFLSSMLSCTSMDGELIPFFLYRSNIYLHSSSSLMDSYTSVSWVMFITSWSAWLIASWCGSLESHHLLPSAQRGLHHYCCTVALLISGIIFRILTLCYNTLSLSSLAWGRHMTPHGILKAQLPLLIPVFLFNIFQGHHILVCFSYILYASYFQENRMLWGSEVNTVPIGRQWHTHVLCLSWCLCVLMTSHLV
jgi:hypothetical protein